MKKFFDILLDGAGGNFVPYQKCPKCDGQGIVSKPPFIAGDIESWLSDQTAWTCDVCNGSKIIPMVFIPNEKTITNDKD